MADQKNMSEGDKVKALLAQLRATLDLEETEETETDDRQVEIQTFFEDADEDEENGFESTDVTDEKEKNDGENVMQGGEDHQETESIFTQTEQEEEKYTPLHTSDETEKEHPFSDSQTEDASSGKEKEDEEELTFTLSKVAFSPFQNRENLYSGAAVTHKRAENSGENDEYLVTEGVHATDTDPSEEENTAVGFFYREEEQKKPVKAVEDDAAEKAKILAARAKQEAEEAEQIRKEAEAAEKLRLLALEQEKESQEAVDNSQTDGPLSELENTDQLHLDAFVAMVTGEAKNEWTGEELAKTDFSALHDRGKDVTHEAEDQSTAASTNETSLQTDGVQTEEEKTESEQKDGTVMEAEDGSVSEQLPTQMFFEETQETAAKKEDGEEGESKQTEQEKSESSPIDRGSKVDDEVIPSDPSPYRNEHEEGSKTIFFDISDLQQETDEEKKTEWAAEENEDVTEGIVSQEEPKDKDDQTEKQEPVTQAETETQITDEGASETENAMQETAGTEQSRTAEGVENKKISSDSTVDNTQKKQSDRIKLAPEALRYKSDDRKGSSYFRRKNKTKEKEEEEDYLSTLPQKLFKSFAVPLGSVNRVKKADNGGVETKEKQAESKPEKKKDRTFPEERGLRYNERIETERVKEKLTVTLQRTRGRFVVVMLFALLLLLLENFTRLNLVNAGIFGDPTLGGIANAALLLGAFFAAYPRMAMGVSGFFKGRVLPESLLFVECLVAFVYTVTFAVLRMEVPHFSFIPVLGLAVHYCFCVVHCENRLSSFSHLTATGDKLVFSPVEKKEMLAELNVLGKSLDSEESVSMYRIRKTMFVKGFGQRTSAICEDSILNGILLAGALGVGIAAAIVSFVLLGTMTMAATAGCFAFFLTIPLVSMLSHIYPMHRALRLAGNDSTILGEKTVHEVAGLDAVAFEDVEVAPTKGVRVSKVKIYAGEPTAVLACITAVFRTVGGPLSGLFLDMEQDTGRSTNATVELEEATENGITATVDGNTVSLGDGIYMQMKKVPPHADPEDAKQMANGYTSIMYVAINECICAKFYVCYFLSTVFERCVALLHKKKVVTLIRTYDPNLSDRIVKQDTSISDYRVHVIRKKVGQQSDFAAPNVEGGIVTADTSYRLIKLLFLCFSTHKAITVQKILKVFSAVVGCGIAVLLAILGAYAYIPSASLAIYHFVWILIGILLAGCGIRIPKLPKGEENESSTDFGDT